MIIKKDQDMIQNYLEDNSNLPKGNTLGAAIPENEEEAVDFIRKAGGEKAAITFSGGGTGTTGGRIPYGGYVLSTEKMNRIKKIGGDFIVLEPGALYQDMEKELCRHNLIFPPNPTETTAFLGGNVSTNASGSRSFKYGAVRDYVNRLRIVLGTGDILDVRRGEITADQGDVFSFLIGSGKTFLFKRPMYKMPDIKNAAGYYTKEGMDLIDLFIGAEGTLGLITEIELRVIPDFRNLCAFFVFLKEENGAIDLVKEIVNRSGDGGLIDPAAVEYFDGNSLGLIREKYPQIPADAGAALYIEQDISDEDSTLERWNAVFAKYKVSDKNIWFGQTKNDLLFYHEVRHSLPEKINELVKKHDYVKLSSDICVPEDKFDKMMNFYRERFAPSGIRYFIFGHIGDSHVHTNLLPENEEECKRAGDIYLALMKKAVSLGGTISAEHGIGKIKHKYLELMYGTDGIKEMARIKKVFDPLGIFNLDNVFPKKYLLS